ncbi:hypothetical protein WR25_24220 isoform G [Diploscapter pachys]|uniref:Globin domain-containing protein n=1 Tax=Diploscapter pachys TaxID=2018661 RepID=A0A2A2LLF3_9BILA|nr:hypothetical protein WR25_24220 isoform A [Diploscapter pachys]PAV86986.1 hypothetical protein WR25_24220 isoform D [Diploscapter pachys]PAV86989.1 hypothetical protein WR25_24220 isoform G [Diploscapter pachys]
MVSSVKIEWFVFSEEEKNLLRESWKMINTEKKAIGCGIYEMIFMQCPEIRRLFPKLILKGGKIDKKATEFSFQALRFVQVIETAIFSLDGLHSVDNILDNLGRRHGKLELNNKFRAYYWSTFLESSICIIRKELTQLRNYNDEKVDQLVMLYRELLRGIVSKIKAGYNADITHRLNQMTIEDASNGDSNARRYSVQTSATAATLDATI